MNQGEEKVGSAVELGKKEREKSRETRCWNPPGEGGTTECKKGSMLRYSF